MDVRGLYLNGLEGDSHVSSPAAAHYLVGLEGFGPGESMVEFSAEDEGKQVVTSDGDTVGTLRSVEGSMAHIEADTDLSQSVRRRLGWTEENAGTYQLQASSVEDIDDEEIRLKEDL